MNNRPPVKVYDRNRTKVIGEVSAQSTSIGAAQAVGVEATLKSKVEGEWVWVVSGHDPFEGLN